MNVKLDRALTGLRPLQEVELDEYQIDIKAIAKLIAAHRKRIKPKKFVPRKGTHQ
jgi:hypothetical protein